MGQEHFRNGEVRLVVEGSVAMRVVRTVASPGAGRDPDDAPVHLVLRSGDTAAHEARLWHADRFDDARLDRLLRRWQELTEEITEGALPYGDPS